MNWKIIDEAWELGWWSDEDLIALAKKLGVEDAEERYREEYERDGDVTCFISNLAAIKVKARYEHLTEEELERVEMYSRWDDKELINLGKAHNIKKAEEWVKQDRNTFLKELAIKSVEYKNSLTEQDIKDLMRDCL